MIYNADDQRVEKQLIDGSRLGLETGIESGARAGGRRARFARRKGSHRNGPMPRLTDER